MLTTSKPSTLSELIAWAERDQKYLWHCRQQTLFSPKELKDFNAKGQFCWCVSGFELRDPKKKLNELRANFIKAQSDLQQFESKIKNS